MTLTATRLRELLAYDSDTGLFTWNQARAAVVRAGERAGSIGRRGYIVIGIDGGYFAAHRLAWLYVTGSWPANLIDHRDGVRTNNRWLNLREATYATNAENLRGPRRDNRSGVLGAASERGRYRARIVVRGQRIALGSFETKEEAHAAYIAAKRQFHEGNTL